MLDARIFVVNDAPTDAPTMSEGRSSRTRKSARGCDASGVSSHAKDLFLQRAGDRLDDLLILLINDSQNLSATQEGGHLCIVPLLFSVAGGFKFLVSDARVDVQVLIGLVV